MARLHAATSWTLSAPFFQELRIFLDTAFEGDFSDDDWTHALGGTHVWVSGPEGLLSHGSVVERTISVGGHSLRVGYVEAVATISEHRRQGHGTTVMAQIGERIRERFPLGALSTGTHAFYETLGWKRWRGPTFVEGPAGRERTPRDDGDIMILRTPRSPHLDLDRDIGCDWRPGDVW